MNRGTLHMEIPTQKVDGVCPHQELDAETSNPWGLVVLYLFIMIFH